MKSWIALAISYFIAVGVAGCVTVNVNFPEGAVQKATDDYVKDLYRAKEQTAPVEKETKSKTGSSFLWFVIDTAKADGFAMKVESPKVKEIQGRQAQRIGKIDQFKKEGIIGECSEGLLVIYKEETLKPLQKKVVDTLIKEENSDRNMLYEEILKINSMNSSMLSQVQKSFFNSFKMVSPAGTWLKVDGQWEKKP